MRELLIVIATAMSEGHIIDKIKEAIDEYGEALLLSDDKKLEQAKTALNVACNLFLMREITKGDESKMRNFFKEINDIEKVHNLVNTPKN